MSTTKYTAALYLRLSREDGDKEESCSIANQRDLAMLYLQKHPEIKLYDEFVDDGYSGSNFERPDFKRMMSLILKNKINCVIVKDLSRFAREYIDAGYYLEKLFPALGIRFISINDNIDYKDDDSNNTKLVIAFKNILNDSYIRDTSVKIRSQLEVKRKKGEYIGPFVVMGYQKCKDDKHKIEIDECAVSTIKRIYTMRFMGISASAIADKLNIENIPSPAEYRKMRGDKFSANTQKKHIAKWTASAVIRILTDEIYTGTLVQGRRTTINYKVKKIIEKDKSQWVIVENNHPAIIPTEFFEKIQNLMKQDTRVSPGRSEPYLFSGFLKCADCGDSLIRKTSKYKDKTYAYYMCATNKLGLGCTSHRIREEDIYKAVFSALHTYCNNVADLADKVDVISPEEIKDVRLQELESIISAKQKEIDDLYKTIEIVENRCNDELENKVSGREICNDIRKSIAKLEKEMDTLLLEKENINEEVEKKIAWIKLLSENNEIKFLNRSALANHVEKICVYEDKRIMVVFNYRDKYMEIIRLLEKVNNREAV